MQYTPNTKVLTTNGWEHFKDLTDAVLWTNKGWLPVTIDRRKMTGDCYLAETHILDLEIPENTTLISYDKPKCGEPFTLGDYLKEGQFRRGEFKVGRFSHHDEHHIMLDDEEWCKGYINYLVFLKGVRPAATNSYCRVSLYGGDEDYLKKVEGIFDTANADTKWRRYPLDGSTMPYSLSRVSVNKLDYYSTVSVGTSNQDNILNKSFSEMNEKFLWGFAAACLEMTRIERARDKSLHFSFESPHKAKVIEYIVSRFTPFSTRISSRPSTGDKSILTVRRNGVFIGMKTKDLDPVGYSGYIYRITPRSDAQILVRGSFESYPVAGGIEEMK